VTTHQYKRCGHCGVEYSYQGSGHGCLETLNDPTWCRTCKQAVDDALKAVPRRFECRYRHTHEMPDRFLDVTLEKLLEWEQENLAPRAEGKLVAQRVFAPLFNLETGDAQNVREVRSPSGQKFMLATWRLSPEYEVKVPWEWDLLAKGWTHHPWR
jgi:hypothetical protein